MDGNDGQTAGGQKKLVESRHAAVVARDGLGCRVHVNNPDAEPQINAVLLIPVEPVQHDVVESTFHPPTRPKAESGYS